MLFNLLKYLENLNVVFKYGYIGDIDFPCVSYQICGIFSKYLCLGLELWVAVG